MAEQPAVTVVTQLYNTEEAYLRQCVESVLGQSFRDFEYLLVDDGCTDASPEILREYARADGRLRLVRFEENRGGYRWVPLARETARGTYLANLDADDWLEPDYLERLLARAEETGADVVCARTLAQFPDGTQKPLAIQTHKTLFGREDFAAEFPYYHKPFRTTWAKLFRTETFRRAEMPDLSLKYGADTLTSFAVLRVSRRVCMDDALLYHYRIHPQSVSYRYDPRRFDSDLILRGDALDFLSALGPVSGQNRLVLDAIYANALKDTMKVIDASGLTAAEKLREYRRMAGHPVSRDALRSDCAPAAECRKTLLVRTINCALDLGAETPDFRAARDVLAPRCAPLAAISAAPLLAEDAALLDALTADDPAAAFFRLMAILPEKGRGDRRLWDIARALQGPAEAALSARGE